MLLLILQCSMTNEIFIMRGILHSQAAYPEISNADLYQLASVVAVSSIP